MLHYISLSEVLEKIVKPSTNTQYPTEREWDARLMIERSKAIKSPSIHYHLAGTKKVQQELALNGVLERFVKEEDKRSAIKSMFTGLYPLDKVMMSI